MCTFHQELINKDVGKCSTMYSDASHVLDLKELNGSVLLQDQNTYAHNLNALWWRIEERSWERFRISNFEMMEWNLFI